MTISRLFAVCLFLIPASTLATTGADRSLHAQRRQAPRVLVTDDDRVTLVPGGSLLLDLPAAREATPSEKDRAHALALFAEGRLLFQREKYAEALQRFQRSYHWNPDVHAPLAEIVPLAFHLKDIHTGTRYAVLSAERDPSQSDLVDPVIAYLSEEQEFERAFHLKRKALAATEPHDPKSAEWVIHQHDLGRLAFLADLHEEAGAAFAVVDDALQKPDDFGLNRAARRAMTRNAEVLYVLMAESFVRSNRTDRAARLFERVQEMSPNDALYAYRKAQVAEANGSHDTALAELQKYLDAGATDMGMEAYELLRKVLQALGKVDDPEHGYVALLERAGQQATPNPLLSFALAEYHREQQRYANALPLYQVSLDGAPTVEGFRGAFECCHRLNDDAALLELLGIFVENGGEWDELEEAGQLVATNPKLQSAVFARLDRVAARGDADANGTEKKAEAEPRKVTPAELFGGGLMAVSAGVPERAANYFDAAIRDAGEEKANWTIAAALEFYVADAVPQAIAWLRRATQDTSAERRPDLVLYLATALELDGQTDAALEVIGNAIPESKATVLLNARQAWINTHAKRFDAARQQCLDLLKEYDKERDDLLVRETLKEVRSQLSNLELLAGDVEQAAEWLEQILDEFPEDAGAMNDLGYLWADANKHLHRSLRMVRYAVSKHPDNYAYLDSLGWALFRLGHYEDAVATLENSAKLSGGDGVILDHLGDAYAKLGRHDAATRAWQDAREAFRKMDDLEKLKLVEEKIARGS